MRTRDFLPSRLSGSLRGISEGSISEGRIVSNEDGENLLNEVIQRIKSVSDGSIQCVLLGVRGFMIDFEEIDPEVRAACDEYIEVRYGFSLFCIGDFREMMNIRIPGFGYPDLVWYGHELAINILLILRESGFSLYELFNPFTPDSELLPYVKYSHGVRHENEPPTSRTPEPQVQRADQIADSLGKNKPEPGGELTEAESPQIPADGESAAEKSAGDDCPGASQLGGRSPKEVIDIYDDEPGGHYQIAQPEVSYRYVRVNRHIDAAGKLYRSETEAPAVLARTRSELDIQDWVFEVHVADLAKAAVWAIKRSASQARSAGTPAVGATDSSSYGKNVERDKWIYENMGPESEGKLQWGEMVTQIEKLQDERKWGKIANRNGLKAAARRYADHFNLPIRNFEGKPKKAEPKASN